VVFCILSLKKRQKSPDIISDLQVKASGLIFGIAVATTIYYTFSIDRISGQPNRIFDDEGDAYLSWVNYWIITALWLALSAKILFAGIETVDHVVNPSLNGEHPFRFRVTLLLVGLTSITFLAGILIVASEVHHVGLSKLVLLIVVFEHFVLAVNLYKTGVRLRNIIREKRFNVSARFQWFLHRIYLLTHLLCAGNLLSAFYFIVLISFARTASVYPPDLGVDIIYEICTLVALILLLWYFNPVARRNIHTFQGTEDLGSIQTSGSGSGSSVPTAPPADLDGRLRNAELEGAAVLVD